jgi:hypothetical protein
MLAAIEMKTGSGSLWAVYTFSTKGESEARSSIRNNSVRRFTCAPPTLSGVEAADDYRRSNSSPTRTGGTSVPIVV